MEKKQIVFSESYSSVMIYKMAILLKEKGYETVLIRLLEQNEIDNKFFNRAFDKVINLNMDHFSINKKFFLPIVFSQIKKSVNYMKCFISIYRLKPYVFIGKAKPNWYIALLRILFFRKTPFIYFPYDLRNQYTPEYVKKTVPNFEIKAEKYCFENSDAIIHKGAPEELESKYINGRSLGDNVKIPEKQLNYSPYCLKEFIVPINKKLSEKDKDIHIVHVGGIKKMNDEFFSKNCFENFGDIIKQKIHMHLYFCNDVKEKIDIEAEHEFIKSFIEKNKDFPNINYLHIHDSYNPKALIKEIAKYDYGTFIPLVDDNNADLEWKFCSGNKIATYFEAGIPLFHDSKTPYIGRILKSYDVDLVYPENLKDIKKMIKKLNYKKLQKNVLKAREDFLMDKHLERLEEFIKEVVESVKNK